jgi:Flp pilus assembly protein TadD
MRLGKDDEAFSEFREVLRVDPRFARARVGLGMILARRDRVADAIQEMYEATRLDPRNGETHVRLAMVLYQGGYYTEAWHAVRRARNLGQQIPADFLRNLEERSPSR